MHDLWLPNENMSLQFKSDLADFYDIVSAHNDIVSKAITFRSERMPNEQHMRNFENKLLKDSNSNRQYTRYIGCIRYVIEKGNDEGYFNICPPRDAILTNIDRSPFDEDTVRAIAFVRECRNVVIENSSDSPEEKYDLELGKLLLSAAINGGLSHSTSLIGFFGAIHKPFTVINDKAYYDLHLSKNGEESVELRRWPIDKVTEIFLLNIGREFLARHEVNVSSHKCTTKTIWSYLNKYFKKYDGDSAPRNISEFLKFVNVNITLETIPVMANYASRKVVSHSLKERAWLRLHKVVRDTGEEETVEPAKITSTDDEDLKDEYRFEEGWMLALREAVKGKNKERAKSRVQELLEECSGADRTREAIIRWILNMIVKGSYSNNPLALGTIRKYLSDAGTRVLGQLGDLDITKLSVDKYLEIYQQAMEDVTSHNSRRHVAYALRELHHSLTLDYEYVEKINYREVLGIGTGLTPVDANIISFDDYFSILRHFDTMDLDKIHPQMTKIVKMIFTIAFRCGTRRMEVLVLLLVDLLEAKPQELLIRPNSDRTLKTKSSLRKLLISSLYLKRKLPVYPTGKMNVWKMKNSDNFQIIYSVFRNKAMLMYIRTWFSR